MNKYDPTLPDTYPRAPFGEELSVEDVVSLEKMSETRYGDTGVGQVEKEFDDCVEAVSAMPEPAPMVPTPIPGPIQVAKRRVSGRYRSGRGYWQLELRVDVDGKRPMKRVSGDFHRTSGATFAYFGSFVVESPSITVTKTLVTIEGEYDSTWSTSYKKVRITIPRRTIFMPPAAAEIRFLTTDNRPGAGYECKYESKYFRTVQYEQDYVKGVTPFTSYNTGSLPSAGPARTLSVAGAYAEAGVEMRTSGDWNELSISGAGSDAEWSDAELHQAMETQFSLWKDAPQWKLWLLEAYLHEDGPTLYGIMFDQEGKQRQGCAAFHVGVGGTSAWKQRDQLYTYVHELGHCFNLFHSFHKKYMTPPVPNRLDSASWMNYPGRYRRLDGTGGRAAFWNDFAFEFDDLEIIHLRHAFRNDIVPGGNPFGKGAALEDPEAFADTVEDNSGLRLELESKGTFAHGEPVVIEIKLGLTDMRGKTVHGELHPKTSYVQIGIQKPNGRIVAYEPYMEHCIDPREVELSAETPTIHESAYIGYGKDGFYFDQPGFYRIRAAYFAMDGSEVLSNTLTLRVSAPLDKTDDEIAGLFLGEDQGKLLYLQGSDSEFLKRGNDDFDLMLSKYPKHPLAVYARLIKGINASRDFKSLASDRKFSVRQAQQKECIGLLSSVVDDSEKIGGVDNITLNMVMRRIAGKQKSSGDEEGARATMKRMVDIFHKKALKPHVMRVIKKQASGI